MIFGNQCIKLSIHKCFQLARLDFQKVLELDPENKAAKNKVTICAHEIKTIKEKEKKTFANMFEKVIFFLTNRAKCAT